MGALAGALAGALIDRMLGNKKGNTGAKVGAVAGAAIGGKLGYDRGVASAKRQCDVWRTAQALAAEQAFATLQIGNQAVGEEVRFEEKPGQPVRMYTGDSWSERTDNF